jgi:SWI/SNF-related matrix-associated actin-dependent regulator 1 of chromatin subfamily A
MTELKPQVMIVDESHYIKSNKAQRTKAVKELSKVVQHKIFLSGTPITNRPSEFYTVLNMLDPRNFSSWMRYVKRYCGAYHDGFGWNVSGATHTDELFEKINGKVMLRRKKADVLKDLPSKSRFVVPMDISNRKEYNKASNDLVGWIRTMKGDARAMKAATAEALVRFGYLKQLSAEGKREYALQWIKDSLDSNGKLILFAVHHVMIDFLADELRNYYPAIVDGRTSMENRQKAVDKFQNDPDCRIFIGNIKAAGVGLTLTASSNVVFLEFPWTPGDLDQAEDRAHRIGQEEQVNIWYLVAANTIEEEIAELLDEKRKVLDAVLDGQETAEDSMISELLKRRMEG